MSQKNRTHPKAVSEKSFKNTSKMPTKYLRKLDPTIPRFL
jgi:hypothetical protein